MIIYNYNLIYLLLIISCTFFGCNCDDTFGQLIIESDESLNKHYPKLTTVKSDAIESRARYTTQCIGLSDCIPLSECSPNFLYDASRLCYSGDRSLYCGGTEYEPYICCPHNPFERSQVCAKILVSGQHYKGLGAFPFVVRVGFKNINTGNLAYPCLGTIIARRVILTAAHCALAKANGHKLSSIRVGEFDTSNDPDCAGSGFCAPSSLNHAISHVIVHPDYVSGKYHHDIALIALKTPINFTVAAQPICLRPDRSNLVVGKRATIFGWGVISPKNVRLPEMQYLDVPLTAWESCLSIYGSTGALDSPKSVEGQWMCAGGEGKDACQGFGGAPLVLRENGIYMQIGIMSFGSDNCGGIQIPSVYTSISHFSQWIENNLPSE